MFRHPHEMESGRTSSISIDLLMFDKNGNIVEEQSSTVKNFEIWDLAGDSKYMKTTLYGLTSSKPGYVILIISANKGIQVSLIITLITTFVVYRAESDALFFVAHCLLARNFEKKQRLSFMFAY